MTSGAVHPLDLPIGPWMIDIGEAVRNSQILDIAYLTRHRISLTYVPRCFYPLGAIRVETIAIVVKACAFKRRQSPLLLQSTEPHERAFFGRSGKIGRRKFFSSTWLPSSG